MTLTTIDLDTFSKNKTNSKVSRREVDQKDLVTYLDDHLVKILEHRGVNHPFLNGYRNASLTKEQEKQLYLETYYYFKDVPFYICSICTLTRDEAVMKQILANVVDEFGVDRGRPHSELFMEFLNKIGISEQEVLDYTPLNSTIALNKGIEKLYTKLPFVKALGALFAEESQSAAMVEKYNAGLENSGYTEIDRFFWTIHIEAEVSHSNAVFNCIFPYLMTEDNRRLFEDGISQYMQLLEEYWDGISKLLEAS